MVLERLSGLVDLLLESVLLQFFVISSHIEFLDWIASKILGNLSLEFILPLFGTFILSRIFWVKFHHFWISVDAANPISDVIGGSLRFTRRVELSLEGPRNPLDLERDILGALSIMPDGSFQLILHEIDIPLWQEAYTSVILL